MKTCAAIASTWMLAAASVGCGNMARDVIVEKGMVPDAGREPAQDASPSSAPRETSNRCDRDGGCAGSRCDPTECSLSCPIGCSRKDPGGSTTYYRTRSRRNPSSWRLERP